MMSKIKYYLDDRSRERYVEALEDYIKDGFHPIHLGDVLNDRYEVIHKLGVGGYGTVWLCRDYDTNKLVSVKVLQGYCTDGRDICKKYELQVHQVLANGPRNGPPIGWGDEFWKALGWDAQEHEHNNHPGKKYVLTLLDAFTLRGPNGKHLCFVTEPVGPNFASVRRHLKNGQFSTATAKRITVMLTQGLAYIHSCGIAHGDLGRGNVLFAIPGLENWTNAKVYKHLGYPVSHTVRAIDRQTGEDTPVSLRAPVYVVESCIWGSKKLLELHGECLIKIVDFGESFFCRVGQTLTKNVYTTPPYTPLECYPSMTNWRVGPSLDVWAFGMLVFEMFANHELIEAEAGKAPDNAVLTDLVRMLGKFPEEFWEKWKDRREYFERDGTFREVARQRKPDSHTIQDRMVERTRGKKLKSQRMSPEDLEKLTTLIERAVMYDAKARITMEEVLDELDDWCEETGLYSR